MQRLVESRQDQLRRESKCCEVGIGPLFWRRLKRSREAAEGAVQAAWLREECDPFISEPLILSAPGFPLAQRFLAHNSFCCQQTKKRQLGYPAEKEPRIRADPSEPRSRVFMAVQPA